MTNLQPLPYSEDFEKGLLCSIRYQPDILNEIHDVLRADVFYVRDIVKSCVSGTGASLLK